MAASIPERPRRILVADDESLAAASIMQCLKQLGYTAVGPARDGEHAVELAFSTRPDLAILDVRMMTDSDGIDTANAMLNELLIPVVIVSAYSDPKQVAGATSAGVFGYLVKPVTKEQLRPAIEIAWARFNEYLQKDLEAENFRRRLEDREAIDKAKWELVAKLEIDEGAALRELRKRARDSKRRVVDVAREILEE
jgi:response regulator NasT